MRIAACIHCEAPVGIDEDAKVSEIVTCPSCGAQMEIVSTDPVEMIEAPEVEEDWGE